MYSTTTNPNSRIATFDVYSVAKTKHHVTALLEFDVTDVRIELQKRRRMGETVSLNAWIVSAIANAVSKHPVAFGIGSVVKKPIVYQNAIQIRQILNMTVLLDHDLLDGAPMVRFIKCLKKEITNNFG